MDSINKLFLNNIARSAAIVGLMFSSLAHSDSKTPFVNFGRAATNFMGNTIGANNFSPNFANNINKVKGAFNQWTSQNPMLNNIKEKFAINKPQAMQQTRSIIDPYGTNKAFQRYFKAAGNNVLMNPASASDLQTAERIANAQYGNGFGMMTKKGLVQRVEEFARNTKNQTNARIHTAKNDIRKQIQVMKEGTTLLKNKVVAGGNNLVKLAQKEVLDIKQLGKTVQGNLSKATEALTKANYFIKEDLKNRSQGINALKIQRQNFIAKGKDIINSLNYVKLDQAKKQIGEFTLRGTTLIDNTLNVLTKKSPNLGISEMYGKQAAKHVAAAVKNAGKIALKTGPAGILIGSLLFEAVNQVKK